MLGWSLDIYCLNDTQLWLRGLIGNSNCETITTPEVKLGTLRHFKGNTIVSYMSFSDTMQFSYSFIVFYDSCCIERQLTAHMHLRWHKAGPVHNLASTASKVNMCNAMCMVRSFISAGHGTLCHHVDVPLQLHGCVYRFVT